MPFGEEGILFLNTSLLNINLKLRCLKFISTDCISSVEIITKCIKNITRLMVGVAPHPLHPSGTRLDWLYTVSTLRNVFCIGTIWFITELKFNISIFIGVISVFIRLWQLFTVLPTQQFFHSDSHSIVPYSG